jgi:two-component system alkaline phosphatase synthesis response regulator PhoP/two-component system response regulator VicR
MTAIPVPDPDFGGNRTGGGTSFKRILVVDDERHIVRLVQVNLERLGYEVAVAYDGIEALEKVKEEKPDLIILDTMMPYMDGFEVIQALKKDPETREIHIIMLSETVDKEDVFRGWGCGVDAWLTKPFNPLDLLDMIRRIFD